MFWVLSIALSVEAALAVPLGRRVGGGVLRATGALLLAFVVLGIAVFATGIVLGLDVDQHAGVLGALVCVGAALVGFFAARALLRLPALEIILAVLVVIELGALGVLIVFGREALGPASPGFRALLVLPAALVLCAYFGASLGYLVSGGFSELRLGYEAFIGRRFLLSKASPVLSVVTTISVIGVALGVAMVIISLAVLGGFEHDLEEKIIGANAHLVMQEERARPFPIERPTLDRLRAHPEVVAASPVIEGEVAVSSQSNYTGGLLFGIDPAAGRRALKVLGQVQRGSLARLYEERGPLLTTVLLPQWMHGWLDRYELADQLGVLPAQVDEAESLSPLVFPAALIVRLRDQGIDVDRPAGTPVASSDVSPPARMPGIVIGVEMAKALSVGVGDKVRVISPMLEALTPVGVAPKSLAFEVAAIFGSKMYEFDAKYAYVSLPAASRFFEVEPGEVTGVQVGVRDAELADRVGRELEAVMTTPAGPKFRGLDWKRRNQTLFSALKLERVVAFVVLVFIILVASFSIVNTLTMSVIEKKREIAILKTLGARDGGVMKLFLVQGLIVGSFGTLFGAAGGVILVMLFERFGVSIPGEVYYIDSLPVHLEPLDVVLVVLAALLIVWDFAVFPALRGARLVPVEGLREG